MSTLKVTVNPEGAGITASVPGIPSPQSFDGVTTISPDPLPTLTVTKFVVPPAV
jgi:hypothetical protein